MLKGLNEDIALPLLQPRPGVQVAETPLTSIRGRRVLITGAGGSIGSELALQVAANLPSMLILADQSEFNLYEIDMTLANAGLPIERVAALADVRDVAGMRTLFAQYQPELVLHAAALKHVPLLEDDFNLTEAIRTNVIGTANVFDQAAEWGADFLLISTDKAVHPLAAMGATKRAAEVYCQFAANAGRHRRAAQVRFGNVLGSSGSVVPLFRRQIAQGGPVTVTHAEMTRYMMTIKEAVGLVLDASMLLQEQIEYGSYVLDMGEPVKILDLAVQLIRQAGLRPGQDIPIEIIGMRPGEKLHEELFYDWERPTAVAPTSRIRKATAQQELPDLGELFRSLNNSSHFRDIDNMKACLGAIVDRSREYAE